MHIETTLWTDEKYIFDELLLLRYENWTADPTVIDRAKCCIKGELSSFFKRCEKRQDTKEEKETARSDELDVSPYTQFGVIHEDQLVPVKWFNIRTDTAMYSHDIAFETTLIEKNSVKLPFGRIFPKKVKSKYRSLKVKKTAYRYLSNQLRNQ